MSEERPDPERDLLEFATDGEHAPRPDPKLRASVLASIGAATRLAGLGERLGRFFDLAHERAAELLREASGDAAGWQPLPVAGVRLFHLAGGPRVAAADCGLVRIEAGARFPAHRHVGDEWSFVLLGEAEEEGTGVRWAPGDLVHRAGGSVHAFRATGPGPFVFAVVLEGGIEPV